MYDVPSDLVRMFRSTCNDTKAPYFWSDSELYTYMTEGEAEIARKLLCLQDTSSAVTLYTVPNGQATVIVTDKVLRVRDAWWLENGGEYKLDIQSQDAMVAQGYRIHTQKGRPNTAMMGSQTNGIRLYPIPENDGQLVLSIYRVPLNPLNAQAQFEIPEQYRGALLDWMQYKAYGKDDAETFDRVRSDKCLNAFVGLVDGYMTTESQRRGTPQAGGIRYGGI